MSVGNKAISADEERHVDALTYHEGAAEQSG